MPQSRILVDSNAYFRLAQSIHPLLNVVFGEKEYCLCVIKELQVEYNRSTRLNNTFPWVNDPEYAENRSLTLEVTAEEKAEIRRSFEFILDNVRNVHPGVSRIDVQCLAHAEVLNIPVVTDDGEMLEAARDYGIATFKTLELLRLMLDCGHIDMDKIRGIAGYWAYLNDTPKDFRSDYKRLFGEEAPK